MLSALELAQSLEAGKLTPRAVVDICAEAIAAREKDIGAFVTLDLAAARRAADDPRLASLPLSGLPVAFKDIFDTADLPTQYGSPIYCGHRPRADAAVVALTRRAGGVVFGKTTQNILTAAKIVSILGILVAGFGWAQSSPMEWKFADKNVGWGALAIILVLSAVKVWAHK